MKIKIQDSFLDKETYINIKNFLQSEQLPWFFRKNDTDNKDNNDNGFFNFCFYNNHRPDHYAYDNLMVPILEKLNCFIPIQVRANLVLRDINTKSSSWHVDNKCKSSKTAILYFTTCNALTILEDQMIESVENRIVIFDSSILHKVQYQTDCHKRYVINFNYIEND